MKTLDAVKSRLGSISKTKLETLPNGVQTLLATDFPNLLKELRAAREVVIYATNFLRFTPHAGVACYSTKCVCFHAPLAESIARYDEARLG